MRFSCEGEPAPFATKGDDGVREKLKFLEYPQWKLTNKKKLGIIKR